MNKYTIRVACTQDNIIGKGNKLPFFSPAEIANFRKSTLDSVLIMGRKTWQSLPNKVLRKRINVVLTRDIDKYTKESRHIFHEVYGPFFFSNLESIDCFIKFFHKFREVNVIGGEEIYNLYLKEDKIMSIILSEIPGEFKGDKYFPDIDSKRFELKHCFEYPEFRQFHYERRYIRFT